MATIHYVDGRNNGGDLREDNSSHKIGERQLIFGLQRRKAVSLTTSIFAGNRSS